MFVTNWISTTKIQKISEITNFFRHYFLSRTEVNNTPCQKGGTLSHFLGIVHCYWQGMPVMEPCLLTLVEEEKSI